VSEDGDIIAGHGRLAAARKLSLAAVPVIVLAGLSVVPQLRVPARRQRPRGPDPRA
jgi:hypothetical protein